MSDNQTDSHTLLTQILNSCNQVVIDKPQQVRLAVSCLLAGGHLLLEDLPGMGKTTLAHTLANAFGLSFNRVQMTSDMMPADILGYSMYQAHTGDFVFKRGPVFCQLLLADELNRTSPKTQSALLEAMEEGQVSIDGATYPLSDPFLVIATQNPHDQAGTSRIPESQLDRFMMCLSLGYPSLAAETHLLQQAQTEGTNNRRADITPLTTPGQLLKWQQQVKQVKLSDVALNYLQRLCLHTRSQADYNGLSPRGLLALQRAAQAYAFIDGREFVTPEDIQAVFAAIAEHRFSKKSVDTERSKANNTLNSVAVITPII